MSRFSCSARSGNTRRYGHRLNTPRLPDGYRGCPTAVLAQIDTNNRLAGGRRNLASRGQLEILDCQQHLGFVGGGDVQAVGQGTELSAGDHCRLASRPVPRAAACGTPERLAVSGFALRMVCQLSHVSRSPWHGLHIGAMVAAAVDQIVPPTAIARAPAYR